MTIKVYSPDDMLNLVHDRGEHNCQLIGQWRARVFRKNGRTEFNYFESPNIFPTQGLAKALNILYGSVAKPSDWYIFVFKNNVTPVAGDTATDKLGSGGAYGCIQDPTDFDNATDGTTTATTGEWPLFTVSDATTGVISNSDDEAVFTFAASITCYGAGLTNTASCSTPGASAWINNAKKFDTARAVVDGDRLGVTCQITMTSS